MQMGGFRLRCTDSEKPLEWLIHDTPTIRPTMMHRAYAYRVPGCDHTWEAVLTFRYFVRLLERELIDFPMITEEEIKDRSKGDALSKGAAFLQIVWFIVRFLYRVHQNLDITALELTTSALAGLNSIVYFCWWSKPLLVQSPLVVWTRTLKKEGSIEMRSQEINWRFSNFDDFKIRTFVYSSVSKAAQ